MSLVARLRIILNDVDPQPMRHVEVPLKIRLDRLHEVMQAAMGWTDTHLYEFRAGDVGWGVPDPDGFYEGPMPAKTMTLEKLLRETGTRTIQYTYDFGDDWDHSIRIERVGTVNEKMRDAMRERAGLSRSSPGNHEKGWGQAFTIHTKFHRCALVGIQFVEIVSLRHVAFLAQLREVYRI